jgi:hypothetical protein
MKNYQRRGRGEWLKIIASQQKSGQSISAWCRDHDVSSKSFYLWRKRLRREPEQSPESFIEIRSVDKRTGLLNLTLPGDYRLEIPQGFDPGDLQLVVKTLAAV